MTASLQVLIAARDRADSIASLIAALREELPTAELLVFDDGSADPTSVQAVTAGARVLRGEVPDGPGVAWRRLIAASEARWLLLIDADEAPDPRALNALWARVRPDVDAFCLRGRRPALRVPRLMRWRDPGPLLIRGDRARAMPLRRRGRGLRGELLAAGSAGAQGVAIVPRARLG